MIDSDLDVVSKRHTEQNAILQEYREIIENFKQDLSFCKAEQSNIRSQIEILRNEGKNVGDMVRDHFAQVHLEISDDEKLHEKQMIVNLQDRISMLQMEKDSAVQLWQVALKAVDALEEELKTIKTGHNRCDRDTNLYKAQINTVKETYSEAIRALEAKLLQARDNFLKQQSLWESSKEKIDSLTKEKDELAQKLVNLQRDNCERDRSNQQTIESLSKELAHAKAEKHKMVCFKAELEEKLSETKRFATNIMVKDEETKCKMAEAIELVDTAIREKDLILQRECCVLEDKAKLERRLNMLSEEHATKLQEEIKKMKDAHDRDVKKYILEIKELKVELREKAILLDRAQRECKLVEEELEKVQKNSEEIVHRSSAKILDLEQKLKQTELELQMVNETCKKKYNSETKQLLEKICSLEERLSTSNTKLSTIQERNSNDTEHGIRYANERLKETIEQCTSLEKRLTKVLIDKEELSRELGTLQSSFEQEIKRRDHDRDMLQHKISELEESLKKAMHIPDAVIKDNLITKQLYSLEQEIKKQHIADPSIESKGHCCQSVLSEQLNRIQDKYDKKIKELTQHVETHQTLSKRWRDEAKLLTVKFQEKFKELRVKISALRKENAELNRELLACRQQLTQYRLQAIHRYNHKSDVR